MIRPSAETADFGPYAAFQSGKRGGRDDDCRIHRGGQPKEQRIDGRCCRLPACCWACDRAPFVVAEHLHLILRPIVEIEVAAQEKEAEFLCVPRSTLAAVCALSRLQLPADERRSVLEEVHLDQPLREFAWSQQFHAVCYVRNLLRGCFLWFGYGFLRHF
jgi:hypothetical protein